MKISFLDKASAQARADSIHAQMKATNALYKASCELYDAGGPGTARWDFPKQDLDMEGKPIGTDWKITVDERPRPVLTKAELDSIPEWKVTVEVVK